MWGGVSDLVGHLLATSFLWGGGGRMTQPVFLEWVVQFYTPVASTYHRNCKLICNHKAEHVDPGPHPGVSHALLRAHVCVRVLVM